MHHFFSTIIYSASNEDPLSELTALALTDQDTVLTITGSGARALDLLIAAPKKIISIDMNEKQNHLLSLKCSAYKNLSYSEFTAFLGIDDSGDRSSIYERLKQDLPAAAQQYWDTQKSKIDKGILYCGVWESYLLKLSWLTKFKSRTINQLFTAGSLEVQQDVWEKKWNGFWWKCFVKTLNVRWVWKYLLKEPGIDLIDKDLHIGHYINERLAHIIRHQDVKSNPFLNLIVFGKYSELSLPLHLQPQHFEKIKQSIHLIEPVTMPLDAFLTSNPDTIDAFSISDFSSYADQTQYQAIWRSIMLAANNGARVCERFFLVNYQPENIEGVTIERNKQLEDKLLNDDHSFIYSFNCATIKK